ncbi:hypothetical protein M2132_000814 [Dysgonomonas sp. PH5-45]|uniref:hypothetical protein n=1 Tax=unclassified Dysgonomonas TaxID=2630389 RepID=UPI002476E255|nr:MULTISPECIES: hypothetical protein [unclassified Dysgonomonas]MDH6354486.1 hypothetical protein [Dysgonomonas sp. PH5-45]MDH6387457.1 hypothetical protein [Dysgonomonas sp. PH5-37]
MEEHISNISYGSALVEEKDILQSVTSASYNTAEADVLESQSVTSASYNTAEADVLENQSVSTAAYWSEETGRSLLMFI